jgi:O-antigen/teichoic acid export membrane protein
MAGGIFILAPEFVQIFIGEKWLPMVSAMQALAFWGLIRSISATTGSVFQAVGKPKIITVLTAIKLTMLAILIYPLTMKWGIFGTSLAVVLASLFSNPMADYMVIKIIRCKVWSFLKLIVYPIINATIICMFLFLTKTFIGLNNIVSFIILVIIAIISYFCIAFVLDKCTDYKLISGLKEKWQLVSQ